MKVKRIFTLTLIVLTILANGLISVYGLFGNEINELSNQNSTVATPDDYAFRIWGLIYFVLLVFGIWQLKQRSCEQLLEKLRPVLWFNLVLNVLWLVFFYAQLLVFSFITIFFLFLTLVFIVYEIFQSKQKRNWYFAVFEVYLGWVSVATIINLLIVLTADGWIQVPTDQAVWWLLVPLLILAFISSLIHRSKNAFSPFSLVLIWAFVAIHIHQKANGYHYTFIPLLPLLVLVPDLVIRLLTDWNYSNNS